MEKLYIVKPMSQKAIWLILLALGSPPAFAQIDYQYRLQQEEETKKHNSCVALYRNAQWQSANGSGSIAVDSRNQVWDVGIYNSLQGKNKCSYSYLGIINKTIRKKGDCDSLFKIENNQLIKYSKCTLSSPVRRDVWANSKYVLEQVRINNEYALEQARINRTPNWCPENFAYEGNLVCRQVICRDYLVGREGNNPDLAGKMWGCKRQIIFRQELDWGSDTANLTNNPLCPKRTPTIGWQSTCHERDYRSR